MIVVCAPDKFRGSLDTEEAAAALAEGARAAGCDAVTHPLADGGEDPLRRALNNCNRRGDGACRLYAVDDHVVWKESP